MNPSGYNKAIEGNPISIEGRPTVSGYKRWYDQDPALSQAIASLREAPDKYQAQIALNIIMIIVEHYIEEQTLTNVDALVQTLADSKTRSKGYFRRWYDLNATLKSAMQLLYDCPDGVQSQIIPSIANMVEETLSQVESD